MPSSPILIHFLLLGLSVLLFSSGDFFGRVAHRPPAGTVDGGVLSRLLTPTQASLARSKSAAALSAEGRDAPGNLRFGDPDREEGGLRRERGPPYLPLFFISRKSAQSLSFTRSELILLPYLVGTVIVNGGLFVVVELQKSLHSSPCLKAAIVMISCLSYVMLCTVVICSKVHSCERSWLHGKY